MKDSEDKSIDGNQFSSKAFLSGLLGTLTEYTGDKLQHPPLSKIINEAVSKPVITKPLIYGGAGMNVLNKYYNALENQAPAPKTSALVNTGIEIGVLESISYASRLFGNAIKLGTIELQMALFASESMHNLQHSDSVQKFQAKRENQLFPSQENLEGLSALEKTELGIDYSNFCLDKTWMSVVGAPADIMQSIYHYANQALSPKLSQLAEKTFAGFNKISAFISQELNKFQASQEETMQWSANQLLSQGHISENALVDYLQHLTGAAQFNMQDMFKFTLVLNQSIATCEAKSTAELQAIQRQNQAQSPAKLKAELTHENATNNELEQTLAAIFSEQTTAAEELLSEYSAKANLPNQAQISQQPGNSDLPSTDVDKIQQWQTILNVTEGCKAVGEGMALLGRLTGNNQLRKLAPACHGMANVINGVAGIALSASLSWGCLGSMGSIFAGMNSILGCFDDEDTGMSDMMNVIMESLQVISNQIHALHQDMLQHFAEVYAQLGFIHKDLLKGFAGLSLKSEAIAINLAEVKNLQKLTYTNVSAINRKLDLLESNFADYFAASNHSLLHKEILLAQEDVKNGVDSKLYLKRHKALLACLNVIADQNQSKIITTDDLASSLRKLNGKIENAYANLNVMLGALGIQQNLIDPIAITNTIDTLLALQSALSQKLAKDFRVSQAQFSDMQNLQEKGESWLKFLDTCQKNKMLQNKLTEYDTELQTLDQIIAEEMHQQSTILWNNKIRLGEPFALKSAQKLQDAFATMNIPRATSATPEAIPYGQYRRHPGGYYHVWYTRTSSGNQEWGSDLFDEWWSDFNNSASRREHYIQESDHKFESQKEAFINTQSPLTLPKDPLNIYANTIATLPQSLAKFAFYKEIDTPPHRDAWLELGPPYANLSDYPLLPVPESLLISDNNSIYLQAEMLSLGRIEYFYHIQGKELIFSAGFMLMGAEPLFYLPITIGSVKFEIPPHFLKKEGVWNVWVGGDYPGGSYSSEYLSSLPEGNGHALGTYTLKTPTLKNYSSKSDQLIIAPTDAVTENLYRETVENAVKNCFITLRREAFQRILDQALNSNTFANKKINVLLDSLDAKAKVIRTLLIYLFHDEVKADNSLSACPLAMTKEELLELLHGYNGATDYFHNKLAIHSEATRSFNAYLNTASTDSSSFNKALLLRLNQLNSQLTLLKERNLIISNDAFSALSENTENTLNSVGFELGETVTLMRLIKLLRENMFNEAADIISQQLSKKSIVELDLENKSVRRGAIAGSENTLLKVMSLLNIEKQNKAVGFVMQKVLPDALCLAAKMRDEINNSLFLQPMPTKEASLVITTSQNITHSPSAKTILQKPSIQIDDGRTIQINDKIRVLGDGNCGFRAIMGGTYLDDLSYTRADIVDYLLQQLKTHPNRSRLQILIAADLRSKYNEFIASMWPINQDHIFPEDIKKKFNSFKLQSQAPNADQDALDAEIYNYCRDPKVINNYLTKYFINKEVWPAVNGILQAFAESKGIMLHCLQENDKNQYHYLPLEHDANYPAGELFICQNESRTHFDRLQVNVLTSPSPTNSPLLSRSLFAKATNEDKRYQTAPIENKKGSHTSYPFLHK